MKMHPEITPDRVIEAVERGRSTTDDIGFCNACGGEVSGCEPDARKLECELCGEPAVYGAEELLIYIA